MGFFYKHVRYYINGRQGSAKARKDQTGELSLASFRKLFLEIDDDGNFNIQSSVIGIYGLGSASLIQLKGSIQLLENNKAVIDVKTTLAKRSVIIIALPILVSLNVLFGDNSLMGRGSRLNNMLILVFIEAVLIILFKYGINKIIRNFEYMLRSFYFEKE